MCYPLDLGYPLLVHWLYLFCFCLTLAKYYHDFDWYRKVSIGCQ